uniref:Ataxin-10 domain-containing protein n=1 Tax=Timema genevievae TaxID=629358 RepID=A0A7R9PHV8_TIMGE|nr:unnamed protein product [Timema genevievae]
MIYVLMGLISGVKSLVVITQWAIFSVRNLCEGNPESQALIAGLTQRGTVDSATLRELGITLHQEDDKKIVIMPYKP